MSLRMEKVNKELRRKITEIIHKEIDDPALEFLSVTRVVTAPDLRESKVYYSLLDETKYDQAQAVLDYMCRFIRGLLGKKVRLKNLPQLNFFPDRSIKYSVDIYQKIEELKREDEKRGNRGDNFA